MKRLIALILPILTILSISTQAQSTHIITGSSHKAETLTSSRKAPDKIPKPVWIEASTTETREFYTAKAAFDPTAEYESLYSHDEISGQNRKAESGIAKLVNNNNSAPSAYYNNAPVGTILKITNPSNGKTAYAVVVGKIPPGDTHSYLLVISDKVARNLSIKDYSSIELISYSDSGR